MKCEIKRRVDVNAEEKEKLLYIKRELEKKGLKVKISVDTSPESETENVEYLGREPTKMPILWGFKPITPGQETESSTESTTTTTKSFWDNEFFKPREIKNPKEIKNPYRSFKELLDGEKEKAMEELKGGKKGGEPIDGMKYELKQVTVKIEVET